MNMRWYAGRTCAQDSRSTPTMRSCATPSLLRSTTAGALLLVGDVHVVWVWEASDDFPEKFEISSNGPM